MKKRYISIICAFLAVIIIPSVLSLAKPQSDFSEKENRALNTRPYFSFSDLMEGYFQEDYENYLSDQFILRDKWVTAKSYAMKLIGKKDINKIYLGKDGYLFEKYLPSDFDSSTVEDNIDLLTGFLNDKCSDYNVGCVIVPSKASVLDNKLPENAIPYDTDYVADEIQSSLVDDVKFLYLKDDLKKHNDEYIYYKSDHHWTSKGAFYAYNAINESFGGSAVRENEFNINEVATGFLGTDYDKLQMSAQSDVITQYSSRGLKTSVDYNGDADNSNSLYVDENLQEKDKYTYFLGGNFNRIDIKTNADNDKTLLLIKDSFSNSLVPFLVRDYSRIIMIDLRYAKENISAVIDNEEITDILVVYNTEKFMTDDNQFYLDNEDDFDLFDE